MSATGENIKPVIKMEQHPLPNSTTKFEKKLKTKKANLGLNASKEKRYKLKKLKKQKKRAEVAAATGADIKETQIVNKFTKPKRYFEADKPQPKPAENNAETTKEANVENKSSENKAKTFDNKKKFNKPNGVDGKRGFVKKFNKSDKKFNNKTKRPFDKKIIKKEIDPSYAPATETAVFVNEAIVKKIRSKKDKISRPKLSQPYFDAAYILRMMSQKRGSINMLIGTLKEQKTIKQVYALAIKVIQNQAIIKKIVEEIPPPETSNQFLVEVLIGDLLFGSKLYLRYRRVGELLFVMENTKKIDECYRKLKAGQVKEEDDKPTAQTVRYIRINLIKTSREDFIKSLLDSKKFTQKKYAKAHTTFSKFKEYALELKPDEFMVDYHFDDVLVFNDAANKTIMELEDYANGVIAIQDKSSLLAIESMQLEPGMKILDACAAPGMKSIAIASRLKNECSLISNDMNPQRYKFMRNFLHKFGVKTDKLLNVDFSKLEPGEYADLDVILLDPSCSGTGMNRRLDYGEKTDDDQTEKRCNKLAKFQLALLDSAVRFRPKRIVYCTCSKLELENEGVIQQLLDKSPNIKYEVVEAFPEWPMRGVGEYEFAAKCLRSDLDTTLTGGFFCCVLQRKEGAEEEEEADEKVEVKNDSAAESETKSKPLPVIKEDEEMQTESSEPSETSESTEGAKEEEPTAVDEEDNKPKTPEKTEKRSRKARTPAVSASQPVIPLRQSARIRRRTASTQEDGPPAIPMELPEESETDVPSTPRKTKRARAV